jgi:uncharacterized protein
MAQAWYRDGLTFECQRCRGCCRGEPGFVWVAAGELSAMAAALGQSEKEFEATYCRSIGERISLCERSDGDCVLLGPAGCLVYEDRPVQCRTFPFWPENLRSAQHWERLTGDCPGVNKGQLHSQEDIQGKLELEKGRG